MTDEHATSLWQRDGLVWPRPLTGDGSDVVGDPCIVWDPDAEAWRMFLFYAPPGHATSLATAPDPGLGDWTEAEVLTFVNPEELPGGTHKPFVVMDIRHPNRAAHVDGRYWLLTISHDELARFKRVQRAWATTLAGPWTLEPGDLIPTGEGDDFDANHVDAATGYWFDEFDTFVYFYMGYPRMPQPHQLSPRGSAIGVATQRRGDPTATKGGVILTPSTTAGHWASGWLGGFQLFRGTRHRWVAILNASPTPPDDSGAITSEEPAPSLGGFAYSDAEFPTSGWALADDPIEWIEQIPPAARESGESTNLWRQHILVTGDQAHLYYNSGSYGTEQLFRKSASRRAVGLA